MAIANGTCVSFCNQPKHNLATSGESHRYVVAFTSFDGGGILLPQESLRHILASPGYTPGTIVVKCYMNERGFNACQMRRRRQCLSNASQHVTIYLQPFPSNSTHKFISSPFQHIFLHICTGTIVVNVTWMKRGLNAGQTHRSKYLQTIDIPFTCYSSSSCVCD